MPGIVNPEEKQGELILSNSPPKTRHSPMITPRQIDPSSMVTEILLDNNDKIATNFLPPAALKRAPFTFDKAVANAKSRKLEFDDLIKGVKDNDDRPLLLNVPIDKAEASKLINKGYEQCLKDQPRDATSTAAKLFKMTYETTLQEGILHLYDPGTEELKRGHLINVIQDIANKAREEGLEMAESAGADPQRNVNLIARASMHHALVYQQAAGKISAVDRHKAMALFDHLLASGNSKTAQVADQSSPAHLSFEEKPVLNRLLNPASSIRIFTLCHKKMEEILVDKARANVQSLSKAATR